MRTGILPKHLIPEIGMQQVKQTKARYDQLIATLLAIPWHQIHDLETGKCYPTEALAERERRFMVVQFRRRRDHLVDKYTRAFGLEIEGVAGDSSVSVDSRPTDQREGVPLKAFFFPEDVN